MTVIDQILNEWAFRCHDGIVNMNDPKKVKILNEILEKYNLVEQEEEQSIDDKINTILSSLTDDEKSKIYKSLVKAKNKIRKVEDKDNEEIKKALEKKQIPEDIIEYIVLKADNQDQTEEIKNIIDNITFSSLPVEGNLNEFAKKKIENIKWLNDLNVSQAGLSLGKGEILLTILFNGAKLSTSTQKKIDIVIGTAGKTANVEIKQKGAVISKEGRSSAYQKMWSDPILEPKKGEKEISFRDKYQLNPNLKLSTWTPIFDRFNNLPNEEKASYVKDINKLLPKYGFEGELSTNDFSTLKKLCKKVAYLAVGDYIKDKKIVLMNSDLDYIILGGNAKDAEEIITNNNIHTDTSFIPRISYNSLPDSSFLEENLLELSNTDHFQLRVSERGNVLDVLNLNDIPLKGYKFTEVKEKLKANISNELKDRAEKILGKDIPSSTTYDVGIKILKPMLVVDGEEHSLKLYTKSTKQIKNEKDEVIGIREIDNIGTLYFAVVADNTVTTLLLLNKEDDNDLYFQIKDHINRKKGGDKEAKILTPPNHVYKIDLDELMGKEKEKQSVELIDPQTLPYKIRTDYRVGANFDHEKFKTGKIVATSAGSGGKGDSRGMVDWIDVKYPELFLRGGKLTDTRRFERILTLASSLIKK
jgi:hypothetical protein